jgi:hypothetical protein
MHVHLIWIVRWIDTWFVRTTDADVMTGIATILFKVMISSLYFIPGFLPMSNHQFQSFLPLHDRFGTPNTENLAMSWTKVFAIIDVDDFIQIILFALLDFVPTKIFLFELFRVSICWIRTLKTLYCSEFTKDYDYFLLPTCCLLKR